ncbi:MAG TPA: GNAT family N-acetyltransferase [Gaiellaceae bacterium]|nr:GNAT family N-acetyltransferase [Gaiellaceae bacterium]
MRIERHDEPARFFALVAPFLEKREAQHNLQLGFRARLEADRHAYGPRDPLLYAVLDGRGDVIAVATQTPPFGLILSEMDDPTIVDALADRLVEDGAELPTASGPVEVARAFAGRWSSLSGVRPFVQIDERIYEATSVVHPEGVRGTMRAYTPADRPLSIDWLTAFFAEAMPDAPEGRVERIVDDRAAGIGSLVLWENEGEVVSLAGHAGETRNGARVGPVYTPPGLRGRGYASALTAALTQRLLERRRFCFLYTDLANPTSNSIYQRIGYRPVTDVTVWRFEPA